VAASPTLDQRATESRHRAAMRIFLIGFMGAGKTTVGRELAARLALDFVDLDQRIEQRVGRNVPEIFAERGEAGFRRLEEEGLDEVLRQDDVVVATGGGCFARPENRARIHERGGISVWLDVPMQGILSRMGEISRQRRPLLRDLGRANELYEERRPAYAEADFRLSLSGREPAGAVAQRIVDLLRGERCAT